MFPEGSELAFFAREATRSLWARDRGRRPWVSLKDNPAYRDAFDVKGVGQSGCVIVGSPDGKRAFRLKVSSIERLTPELVDTVYELRVYNPKPTDQDSTDLPFVTVREVYKFNGSVARSVDVIAINGPHAPRPERVTYVEEETPEGIVVFYTRLSTEDFRDPHAYSSAESTLYYYSELPARLACGQTIEGVIDTAARLDWEARPTLLSR